MGLWRFMTICLGLFLLPPPMLLLLPPWVLLVVGFACCLGMVVRFFLVVGFFLVPPWVFPYLSHRHSHKPPHNHTPILPSLSVFLSFAFNPTFQIGHNPISWSTFSFFSSMETLSIRHSSLPSDNAVVFRRKVQAFNLSLFRTTTAFPTKSGQALLDYKVEKRESVDDGFLESFVNVLNLISMGRLISSPVLDWYVFFFLLIIYVLFG